MILRCTFSQRSIIRIIFLLTLLFLPAKAFALAGDWKEDKAASARLISGVEGVGEEEIIPLGLEIKLAKGWHTYWRSPGQAGLPPQLDWSGSLTDANNLSAANLHYPAPRRSTVYGLETVGYSDSVVFPVDAVVRRKGKLLNANVSADLLLCLSVCLPAHFDLSLSVPEGPSVEGGEALLLRSAREQLPTDPNESGILLKNVSTDEQSLRFLIEARDRIQHPDIFIESDNNVGFSAPEVKVESDGFSAELKVKPVDVIPEGVTLSTLPLRLTIINGDKATEISTSGNSIIAPPQGFMPVKPSFTTVLLLALLGGFILNLMPCVLPVLSLKIVGVLRHGGGDKPAVRKSFFVTAAGIVFSFLVLASVMVVLKRLEMRLGWGVQFQQPEFLMVLVVLLVFFASNLWGFFEISLPGFVADKMTSTPKSRLAGDFATGAFATLLATPCSAPFLGTAVGFALAAGSTEIFGTFTALGVGMAIPYLLVAAYPGAATALPKPGPWMVRLRQLLGFVLALTAGWLVWIMSAQLGDQQALIFMAMMGALTLFLAIHKRIPSVVAGAGIVLICGGAAAVVLMDRTPLAQAAETDHRWVAYNPATLRADIDEGKTVFLDVTADWCLTCKANKLVIMRNDEVVQRLFHSDVVAMQANWTNPDPVVTELLQKYGRYGIPFDVVYGPGAPDGIVLPELLAPSTVMEAITKASKPRNSGHRTRKVTPKRASGISPHAL